MPCRDDAPWPTKEEWEEIQAKDKEREFIYYKTKVDELTNMLCALGGEIEKYDSKILTHKYYDIGNWYYIHKNRDIRREEEEKRDRKGALLYKKRQLEELKKEIAELKKFVKE
jgi:predicted RNase H-like nuclease (RuvC/YqgF family)